MPNTHHETYNGAGWPYLYWKDQRVVVRKLNLIGYERSEELKQHQELDGTYGSIATVIPNEETLRLGIAKLLWKKCPALQRVEPKIQRNMKYM